MTDKSSDILIVGAGLAGFTAAVRASEQGAKVLLIDKSHGELGDGNVLMASGSLRAGGKSPKTAAKELYDFVMSEGLATPISSKPGRKLAAVLLGGYRRSVSRSKRRHREESGSTRRAKSPTARSIRKTSAAAPSRASRNDF